MKFTKTLILFLVLNFGALALGSWLMNDGPQTDWYINLNKAPWTPAGWVFGAAWTTIMLCFSFFMSYLYLKQPTQRVIGLFVIQWLLNVSWNYVFFNQHLVGLGLAIIAILTIVVGIFFFNFKTDLKAKRLLILPYLIWLCIATSLNAYILVYN